MLSDTSDYGKLHEFALRLALNKCYSSSWVQAPEDLARDLAQRAIAKLQQMERETPEAVTSPMGLVRSTVTTRFIDHIRKRKRQAALLKRHGELLAPVASTTGGRIDPEDEEDAARCLAPFLLITRHEGWASGSAKVNFKAVFLCQLRLAVLEAAAGRCPEYEPPLLLRIAKLTVPWPRRERRESFWPDWPSMEDTWSELAQRYPEQPKVTEAKGFVEVVGELTDADSKRLTVAQWHQWIRRSRLKARQLVPEPIWEECFEPLCPSRKSTADKKGGEG